MVHTPKTQPAREREIVLSSPGGDGGVSHFGRKTCGSSFTASGCHPLAGIEVVHTTVGLLAVVLTRLWVLSSPGGDCGGSHNTSSASTSIPYRSSVVIPWRGLRWFTPHSGQRLLCPPYRCHPLAGIAVVHTEIPALMWESLCCFFELSSPGGD